LEERVEGKKEKKEKIKKLGRKLYITIILLNLEIMKENIQRKNNVV
jgi:hypothetical protein